MGTLNDEIKHVLHQRSEKAHARAKGKEARRRAVFDEGLRKLAAALARMGITEQDIDHAGAYGLVIEWRQGWFGGVQVSTLNCPGIEVCCIIGSRDNLIDCATRYGLSPDVRKTPQRGSQNSG